MPAGFQDELVTSVSAPTALAFTPDGRLLITTQSGRLRIYRDGTLLPTPALDLRSVMCANVERGLLGVAVDPGFSSNRFIYLFYTFNKFGACVQNSAQAPVNRVSRFTLADTNTVSRSSEVVLIDNIPSPNANHNGGDLHVGADGYLYVSVGDGGCDYLGDSGCAGANDAARDEHVLLGKILRITTTGGIPSTNPFLGAGTVRCNVSGRAAPGQKCQETFAWGLRNPFRMAFDPNAAATHFFINDVGQQTWEEIDEGVGGADYGWSVREGHCAKASTSNCGTPPRGMVNPIFDYPHSDGCSAITGGAFVPRGVWPAEYEGAYLFSDYVCGSIFVLAPGGSGTFVRRTFASALGESSAVTMVFGPWGASQALYYTSYAGGGQVRRIVTSTDRAPVVTLTTAPRSGAAPLTVHLDASASSDPDGDALSFEWAFGDGVVVVGGAVVSHTYSAPGHFTAAVTVRDGRGAAGSASVAIDAGNAPPIVSIVSPSAAARFSVGQTITLTGGATDPEEGVLPSSRLSWIVLLHHDTHTHPFVPATAGNGITFQAPPPEDLAATSTSFLEILLTATDSQGATATVRRDFQPKRVTLTFDTAPSGLSLSLNGVVMAMPRTVTSWDGYQIAVSAGTQASDDKQSWLFASWSDSGAAAHTLVTPAVASAFTAMFAAATAIPPAGDAYVRAGAYANTNFGPSRTLVVKQSATVDLQRRTYLRFLLPATVDGRVVLRLRGGLAAPGTVPVGVYPVMDTAWTESALTWNTQPAAGSIAIATTAITSTATAWYDWDVTAYVRSQQAAGKSAIAVALAGISNNTSYPVFSSREDPDNTPALLVGSATADAGDIVLYTSDATAWSGTWQPVADPTAAGGQRMSNPDGGAAKLTAPLASPANYVELSFTAEAHRGYRLWMRGKADRNKYVNDSVYIQFSGSADADGTPAYRLETTSAAVYTLEDCVNCGVAEWGWQDNGFGTGVMGPLIYFAASGPQKIRIQTREDGLSIDQVVLSSERYLTTAPGELTNDRTIVPKP